MADDTNFSLAEVIEKPAIFVVVQEQFPDEVVVASGPVTFCEHLTELRQIRTNTPGVKIQRGDQQCLEELNLVAVLPFAQIREKGFPAHKDTKDVLRVLSVTNANVWSRHALLHSAELLHDSAIEFEEGCEFQLDMSDEIYASLVRRVIENEIGGGEGSSFVISREGRATLKDFSRSMALTVMRKLLSSEFGSYWTFLYMDPHLVLIGASPERHLTIRHGQRLMIPISGTLRKADLPDASGDVAVAAEALSRFLRDTKEVEELFMVTDEEVKMICRICPEGGQVQGPYLREMAHLFHTEYRLCGDDTPIIDAVEALRLSMFAPTVTGSPMHNACAKIVEYEKKSRGYYGSAIVMFGSDFEEVGGKLSMQPYMDSAITIRTVEVDPQSGELSVRAGATIVRHSDPASEARETGAKMQALRRVLQTTSSTFQHRKLLPMLLAHEPLKKAIEAAMAERNERGSQFWLCHQDGAAARKLAPRGCSAIVMNNEDDFVFMLCYVLRVLGVATVCVPWKDWRQHAASLSNYDFVVIGPGPGDPRNSNHPKISFVQREVARLHSAGTFRLMCVCLGHQVLAHHLGLKLVRKDSPCQGVQIESELFGQKQLLGYYNSFHVPLKQDFPEGWEVSGTDDHGVSGMRGPKLVSFQFHPESILTPSGLNILREAVVHVLK